LFNNFLPDVCLLKCDYSYRYYLFRDGHVINLVGNAVWYNFVENLGAQAITYDHSRWGRLAPELRNIHVALAHNTHNVVLA
jgi:hypothetical protein